MTGILLATRMEADPLIRRLDASRVAGTPFPVYRFATGVLAIGGIGKRRAAAATEYLLDEHSVSRVVNVGICGSLGDGLAVGQLCRITSAVDGDGEGQWTCIADSWPDLAPVRLASVAEAVFEDGRRTELATRADVVDMEGAAVARVCNERNVPCCLIKGVSDLADHTGKQSIRENVESISRRLADTVARELAGASRDGSPLAKVARFAKVEHTLFSPPLLLAGGWLGAGGWPGWRLFALIALAGVGARTLGMSANRIFDRRLDALNPRTAGRELPSGQMSLPIALAVAAAGTGLYLLACRLLGPLCLMLAWVPAVPLIGYSLLKRFTPLCHFGIGLCLALAPLGAYVAASGALPAGPKIALLAAFAFCWISGADIVYALADMDSDRQTGVRSIPASLGARRAQVVAWGVHAFAMAAATGLWLLGGSGVASAVALLAAAVLLGLGYHPRIPIAKRFFPIFTAAGIAGAMVVLLGSLR